MSKSIVQWDIDEATYIGYGDDGVYFQVGQRKTGKSKGWYVTAVVDCNTSGFCENMITDDGPYVTEDQAIEAGKISATDWCLENEVDYSDQEEGE